MCYRENNGHGYSVHCREIGEPFECIHHRVSRNCHSCGIPLKEQGRFQIGKLCYCIPCHEEAFGKIIHVVVDDDNWPKTG